MASAVGKTYRKRPVVRNVTVQVRRGEAVGLLGPNGAGKTTTFYMIVGLVRPDSGSITLDGQDITGLPMYRRARLGIGYLPQEASVYRGLSVERNILASLEVVEPDPDRRRQMLDELLQEFGIAHLRRTPALALSGGERRRVEIARALASRPRLLLLDEPTAGMNPAETLELAEQIKSLHASGLSILIIEHKLDVVTALADTVVVLDHGVKIAEGRPEEVRRDEQVLTAYLGRAARAAAMEADRVA